MCKYLDNFPVSAQYLQLNPVWTCYSAWQKVLLDLPLELVNKITPIIDFFSDQPIQITVNVTGRNMSKNLESFHFSGQLHHS